LYGTLELGALAGVPTRPDQLEEITRLLNGTRIEWVRESDRDGDPPPVL
jgi:hypothetical protein